jgi:hypothetical protein
MVYLLSEGTAAERRFPLYLVDATDGLTAETGEAAGQPQISKNGGAFSNTSATLTAVGNGSYYVELTAGELDTLGMIQVRYKSANTAEFSAPARVVAYDPFDAVRQGLTSLPNAAAEAAGGLYTRGTGAGQINQTANGTVNVQTVLGSLVGNVSGSVGSVLGSIVGNVSGSVGSVVGSVGGSLAGNVSGSVASVTAAVTTTFQIKKNTALGAFEFPMYDSADGRTGKTGLTVTGTRSLDGAAFGALTNAVAEVANGIYKVDLAAGDLNADVVTLKFTATGADATLITIITQD